MKNDKHLVIIVHGKDSHPSTSNTVKIIREHLEPLGYDVEAPAYASESDFETLAEFFDNLAYRYNKTAENAAYVTVIGTSLGGFWGRYIAARIKGATFLGLNPSFKFYGESKFLREFVKKPNIPTKIVVALDDDVVDPEYAIKAIKNTGYVVKLPKGGHRLAGVYDRVLPEIEKFLNGIYE